MILNGALRTDRLLVRPFGADDAVALVDLFRDPRVHRFVDDGLPLSEEVARLWIERSGENLRRFGYGTGAVVLRASGELVGWAGFARPAHGEEQVIYGLHPSCWGFGLGRELLGELIRFAWARGHKRIRATVSPRNTASVRLLEHAGFTLGEKGHQGDPECNLYELDGPMTG